MESEETYTVGQAAKILKLTQARLYQLLGAGELEGYQDSESNRWRIPKRAVHALMEERPERRSGSTSEETQPDSSEHSIGRVIELENRLMTVHQTLGRMEGRLELTEKTESTLREERDRLLRDLEREREDRERLQAKLEDMQRPWWRKLFGG
jgi:excisionase family DNA binding protein